MESQPVVANQVEASQAMGEVVKCVKKIEGNTEAIRAYSQNIETRQNAETPSDVQAAIRHLAGYAEGDSSMMSVKRLQVNARTAFLTLSMLDEHERSELKAEGVLGTLRYGHQMAQKDDRRGQAIVARQYLKAISQYPKQVEYWQACFQVGLGLEFSQDLLRQGIRRGQHSREGPTSTCRDTQHLP